MCAQLADAISVLAIFSATLAALVPLGGGICVADIRDLLPNSTPAVSRFRWNYIDLVTGETLDRVGNLALPFAHRASTKALTPAEKRRQF